MIIQENSLLIDVDGNLTIGTNLDLNGKSGKQGIFSGSGGPGGWRSGKGLKNTELFANLHPSLDGQGPGGGRGYEIGKSTGGGSYGNSGSGGLNGGIPGIVYGDESITNWSEVPEVVMQSLGAEIPEEVEVRSVQCLEISFWNQIPLFP